MFLLPPLLLEFLGKRQKARNKRVFLMDEKAVVRVKEIAVDQQRGDQEVYNDIVEAGIKVLRDKDLYASIWKSLSHREQQISPLTCLGYKSYADHIRTSRVDCKGLG